MRIILPKGAHVPQCEGNAAEDPTAPARAMEPESQEEAETAAVSAGRKPWAGVAIAGAAVILLSVLAIRLARGPASVDPLIREAWGPLAQPDAI